MATKNIDRRDFLRLSAIAGGGIGLSSLSSLAFMARSPQAAALKQDELIATCCNMCGGTTGILARVYNGRVIKIEPNSSNPVGVCNISTDYEALKASGARMCPKGNAGIMSLYDPDRLKKPLKRVGERGAGQWQEISYREAVAEIAAKLAEIKATSGPEKVLWFTEDNSFVPIQQGFCNVFGTPNFLQHSNLCDVARKFGFERTLGNGRPLADLRNTRYMLIFGWNPLSATKWAHLPRILLDGLARGAKLVLVDPRCSETAEKALMYGGRWLAIKPGTDGALALAMANVIIREGLYDADFVSNWTVGFTEFAALVKTRTPEWADPITGIPATTIRTVARELAVTKPAVVDAWSGPGQHMNGAEGSRAIAALAGLIGQIDAPGTLILPGRKTPKFDVPAPSTPLPARVDGGKAKYPYAHPSGVYVEAREAMLTGQPYRPKAAFFVMQNFVFSVPNTRKNLDALNTLELIVSVDTHMSETALMADYVIPGTNYLERYELLPQWVTFPVVALRQPVVPPVFGQKPEYEFVKDLALQLGYNDYPFNVTYETFLDDALKAGLGFGLTELQAMPGATWIGGNTEYHKYQTSGFATPSKKFEFYSQDMKDKGLDPLPDFVPTEDRPSAAYPLYIINWKEALHTHSRTMNNRWLMQFHGENELWININRAQTLGIGDGDIVTVENQYGKAQARAKVTRRIHPDVVGMVHGFGHWAGGPFAEGKGTNDGQFVPGKAERLSGMAALKDGAVRVYR
ncbi:MAG: molybdopterin-dependent oxidoreductase [Vicinamibacterales bacterium]